MKRILAVALFFALALGCMAQPADVDIVYSGAIPRIVLWDEPTTDINGEPFLPGDQLSYRVYYALAPGVDDAVLIAEVVLPEATIDLSSLYRGYYYIGVSAVGTTAEGAVTESGIAWSNSTVAVGPTSRFAYLVAGPLYLAPPTGLQTVSP